MPTLMSNGLENRSIRFVGYKTGIISGGCLLRSHTTFTPLHRWRSREKSTARAGVMVPSKIPGGVAFGPVNSPGRPVRQISRTVVEPERRRREALCALTPHAAAAARSVPTFVLSMGGERVVPSESKH